MVLPVDGVVTVAGGRVRGVWQGDQWAFLGVPYARAPEGDLRWRPPLPPVPWDGVRDASTFGPIAPQAEATDGFARPSEPGTGHTLSEDCLSVNVWTPELPMDHTGGQEPGRPVMVWIHGGGFTSGSGSVFLYRGGQLVRNGDVVVVTINYRLGALGFLGHGALRDPGGFVGNWGLHDQVAALRWVRDHIARFGGDAERITIFGESAGGFSIAALMGAPSAAGLFRRAVVQSGGVHVHSLAEAERAASRLAVALGVSECTRETLCSVPFSELVAATEVIAKGEPDPGLIPLPFLPVVDGVFLPRDPLEAVEGGSASDVELLIGTNRDELTLFGIGRPELLADDEAGVLRWAALAAPDVPSQELLEGYRLARANRSEAVDPRSLTVAMGSDGAFRWPSLRLAAAHGSLREPDLRLPLRVGVAGLRRNAGLVPWPGTAVCLRRRRPAGGAVLHRRWCPGAGAVGADAAGLAVVCPFGRSIARRARRLAHVGHTQSIDHGLRAPDRRGRRSTGSGALRLGATPPAPLRRSRLAPSPSREQRQGRWQNMCHPAAAQAARTTRRGGHDDRSQWITRLGPTKVPGTRARTASHATTPATSANQTTLPGSITATISAAPCVAMPRRGTTRRRARGRTTGHGQLRSG